ncbi:MAG: signal peptidase II [Spirochaetes bacterium]|jgi:signal peptidase II|nr:signal peptidase II [Spirochaetota bacterium]
MPLKSVKKIIRPLLAFALILANIGCDQYTKFLAKREIRGRGVISVIGDFFVFSYAENDGAFMSAFSGFDSSLKMALLVVLPLVLIGAMSVYLLVNKTLSRGKLTALCFIAGGGAGNLIDRLLYGNRVTDFMNIGIGGLRSGIFNFADLSIMIGSLILLISAFEEERLKKKRSSAVN